MVKLARPNENHSHLGFVQNKARLLPGFISNFMLDLQQR
jgi:hypothetical protein